MIDWSSLSTSELFKLRGEINAELREPWRTVEALATNGNGSHPSPGMDFRVRHPGSDAFAALEGTRRRRAVVGSSHAVSTDEDSDVLQG